MNMLLFLFFNAFNANVCNYLNDSNNQRFINRPHSKLCTDKANVVKHYNKLLLSIVSVKKNVPH